MDIIEIASRTKHLDHIKKNKGDLWVGTPFEGYRHMDPKDKGSYGENIVSDILVDLGFTVKDRMNSGHDRIINDIKTEIKFSLANSNMNKGIIKVDYFVINHVALGKDWDRLLFLGINPSPNKNRFFWISKDDMKQVFKKETYFGYQQGGEGTKNDDFMCSGTKLKTLMNSDYVKDISQW